MNTFLGKTFWGPIAFLVLVGLMLPIAASAGDTPGAAASETQPAGTGPDLSILDEDGLRMLARGLMRRVDQLESRLNAVGDVTVLRKQIQNLQAEVVEQRNTIAALRARLRNAGRDGEGARDVAKPDAVKRPAGFDPTAYKYTYEVQYMVKANDAYGQYEDGPFKGYRHATGTVRVRVRFKNESGEDAHAQFVVQACRKTKSGLTGEVKVDVIASSRQIEYYLSASEVEDTYVTISHKNVAELANFFQLGEVQFRSIQP